MALEHIRICDFTGQLAGAGATRYLAAYGAEVFRIEDPVTKGMWDILRAVPPYVDDRRGVDFGGAYNNHNVGKEGITLNLRTDRAREILAELIAKSDVVSENFATGVMAGFGFTYERMKELRPDIIYVSNCGFGHRGPYRKFKTWGPIVQAVCGLTYTSGLPNQPPAGWGFSYMDHHGGNWMAIAILAALIHRERTGEGQWVDMACTDAGAHMLGPMMLEHTANGRVFRSNDQHSTHSDSPRMAPHNIYASAGTDDWVAIACRDDGDWKALAGVIGIAPDDERFATVTARKENEGELDDVVAQWCVVRDKFSAAAALIAVGVPASPVQKPEERIDHDIGTSEWGLWPTVEHAAMGSVRVDGLPAKLSKTPWSMTRGGPVLSADTETVLGRVLGYSPEQVTALREAGVV